VSRLAIITGASSGIGRSTAEALAKRGYRTVLIGRRREVLGDLAQQLSAEAPSEAYPLDVTERERVAETVLPTLDVSCDSGR
jgi:NADP-dependent 3-hydroxy acid dehydrogenase YdfG